MSEAKQKSHIELILIGAGIAALVLGDGLLLAGAAADSVLVWLVVALGVAACAVGVALTWRRGRTLEALHRQMVGALNRTASGDLDSELGIDSLAEVEELRTALESVRSSLKNSKRSRD